MIRYLTVDDLLDVVDRLHGGQRQIRDLGLLASAVARPQTTVFGADAYPEFEDKAAALLHSLARNHPSSTATSASPGSRSGCSSSPTEDC